MTWGILGSQSLILRLLLLELGKVLRIAKLHLQGTRWIQIFELVSFTYVLLGSGLLHLDLLCFVELGQDAEGTFIVALLAHISSHLNLILNLRDVVHHVNR